MLAMFEAIRCCACFISSLVTDSVETPWAQGAYPEGPTYTTIMELGPQNFKVPRPMGSSLISHMSTACWLRALKVQGLGTLNPKPCCLIVSLYWD